MFTVQDVLNHFGIDIELPQILLDVEIDLNMMYNEYEFHPKEISEYSKSSETHVFILELENIVHFLEIYLKESDEEVHVLSAPNRYRQTMGTIYYASGIIGIS